MTLENHTHDWDCAVVDGVCVECGVSHGDPCPGCGGTGFHNKDDCNGLFVTNPKRTAREKMWADLTERGFHCIYDSEYGPHTNADAICLFNLYPRLMQKHGSGVWCTAPGRALIVAFGIVSDEWNDPRAIATRIAESWSDIAVIALADAAGVDAAARSIAERVLSDIQGAATCQPSI